MQRSELEALADRIADVAAHIDAATHALLTDIRVFDEAGGWYAMGALSCAHYLSWRIGMGLGPAREKVRVARALASLPRIDEALASGRLSYSKVRALTRVATAETEQALLEIATCSTAAQLEKICRLYRQTQSVQAGRPKDEEDRRWIASRSTDDGMVRLSIQLRPEEAATVLKAIDVSAETGSKADRLMALAESALFGVSSRAGEVRPAGAAESTGAAGAALPAGAAGAAEPATATDPALLAVRRPVEVMVHVDAGTLQGHIADSGDGISAETCRRLCCDAGVVPVIEGPRGETLDVGRKRRTIPAAIRRALVMRDGGCRFPGCTNHRFVDGHHIEHWMDGGETRLSNLTLLCRTHHRFVHEYGYAVEMVDGEPVFRDPSGRVILAAGARPPLAHPVETLRARIIDDGAAIDPTAQIPNWDGQAPQYGWIIDNLVAEAERARAAS